MSNNLNMVVRKYAHVAHAGRESERLPSGFISIFMGLLDQVLGASCPKANSAGQSQPSGHQIDS